MKKNDLNIGTKFQKIVWNTIAKIPKGKVLTYQELANEIGCPKSFRAVANACGKNPYVPEIPCHRVVRKGQVDWVTLNRPESLNAITTPMVSELRDYFGSLMENQSTRIVVLRGAGRGFCAGLDIKASQAKTHEQPFAGGMGFQGYLADVYIRMRRCPQPIISLIHGPACGGGFSFVLASDIRIAGVSAKMNAAYIRIGLSACDMGSSYFLPRLVGTSVASELMLTGRFINAERALSTNLVSEVVADQDLEEAAGS